MVHFNKHSAFRTGILGLTAVLALLAWAAPVWGEVYLPGTKPMGMGGAFVSVCSDNNAIQYNPAGMSIEKRYGIDLNYERREILVELPEDETGKNIKDLWHLSIVDSGTWERVGAGLSFTSDGFPNKTFKENEGYRVALAFSGDFYEVVYLGVSGKYMRFDDEQDGITMDAGLLVAATPWIHFGVAGYNLVPIDEEELAPGELALGVSSSILGYLTVAFDAVYNWDLDLDKKWNFHAGVEGVIAGSLALRGGYFFEEMFDRDYYSAGISYFTPTGSIGYTFQGNVQEVRTFSHSIQVSVQF